MSHPGPAPTAQAVGPRLSPAAFADGFAAAAPALWTVAAGILGDRTEAEDVLQEAAMIGLQRLSQFQPGTDLRAWCGRIVRFVALNRRRRVRRRRTEPVDPEVLAESRPAPATVPPAPVDVRGQLQPGSGAFDDALEAALARLRPTARACLLLKVVQELDYAAIAATLGIPQGTAMSHVHRARAALRADLAAQGIDR